MSMYLAQTLPNTNVIPNMKKKIKKRVDEVKNRLLYVSDDVITSV